MTKTTDTTPKWEKRFDEEFSPLSKEQWPDAGGPDLVDATQDVKDFISQELKTNSLQLLEEIEREVIGQNNIGTSKHGNCCTCQTCHNFHDECSCDQNHWKDQQREKLSQIITRIKES